MGSGEGGFRQLGYDRGWGGDTYLEREGSYDLHEGLLLWHRLGEALKVVPVVLLCGRSEY